LAARGRTALCGAELGGVQVIGINLLSPAVTEALENTRVSFSMLHMGTSC
jgi:hypothetical protein